MPNHRRFSRCQVTEREKKGEKVRRHSQGPHPLTWGEMAMGPPSCQIQEGSTSENHRWWETCQGFKSSWDRYWHSLSQTAFSPLIRVILYDSTVYGLKLVLQCLWSPAPLLFLLGFLSFPLSPPSFLFAMCPSDSHINWKNIPRTVYQLTHQGLQGGGEHCLDAAWSDGGHVWDLCCRTSASSPRKVIRQWGMGV